MMLCSNDRVKLRNLSKLAVLYVVEFMVLETNMRKTAKLIGHDTRLTKIGRSFINSRALGLKRQGQIFDGMVT